MTDAVLFAVNYLDLIAPRIGGCLSQNEECSAIGVHRNPRRKYFMMIGESPVSERDGKLTFEIEMTSIAITGERYVCLKSLHLSSCVVRLMGLHSYTGSGTITVECDEDECTSIDRFFLPVGNVPYTRYLNGGQQ